MPGDSDGKESACNAETFVQSLGWEDSLEREWLPTSVLPGESHGPRSQAGYSPWGCKGSDMTDDSYKSPNWKWNLSRHLCVGAALSCKGFSLWRAGSQRRGSAVAEPGLLLLQSSGSLVTGRPKACGI